MTNKFHSQNAISSCYIVSPNTPTLDISHELRTPLTVIQGALDLLDSGKLGALSDKGQHIVKVAASNVQRLIRLTAAIEQGPEGFFDMLSAKELAQLRMEQDLRLALSNHQMRLQYQPVVLLGSGNITGFEALPQWDHPTLGTIPSREFIPLAEATNGMIAIGAWVMREACQQLQSWQQQFPSQFQALTISVNLSSSQIADPNLPQQIEQILQDTHLSGQSLKIEITESSIMADAEVTEQVVNQLQALGVQLYIDDFGTGGSSLNRLLELPLNVLKIDRTFVQQLSCERGEYLVRAIASLAQNLGIDMIAEGVETEEQVLKLLALGCHRGQGYFFAKPMDGEKVPSLFCELSRPI